MHTELLDMLDKMSSSEIVVLTKCLNNRLDTNQYFHVTVENGTEIIAFVDVLYIEVLKHNLYVIRTFYNTVTTAVIKVNFLQLFIDRGFVHVINNCIVNMTHIKFYDSQYNRVYFNDADYVDATGASIVKIRSILGKDKDASYNTTLIKNRQILYAI